MNRLALATVLFSACGLANASAATPLPTWYGQPGTTYQAFRFTTDQLVSAPEILENPYGPAPVASVNLVPIAAGWQNPADDIHAAGVNRDGAWEVGPAGNITLQMAAAASAPPPDQLYRIHFQVYSVVYLSGGFTVAPVLDAVGLTMTNLNRTQSTVLTEPFPATSWDGISWTGHIDTTNPNVTFRLSAPSNLGSVMDSFEVFTNVELIPEPGTTLLVAASALSALCLRRRA